MEKIGVEVQIGKKVVIKGGMKDIMKLDTIGSIIHIQ